MEMLLNISQPIRQVNMDLIILLLVGVQYETFPDGVDCSIQNTGSSGDPCLVVQDK